MARKVIIHAGFHKTGTTSVSRFMRQNRQVLAPHAAVLLNGGARDLIQATRGYSRSRDPITMMQIEFRLERLLTSLNAPRERRVFLCIEEISGLLPGLPGDGDLEEVADYGAAPALAAIVAEVCQRALTGPLEVTFYYSTRDPAAWLNSVYWQHVKAQHMTEDRDDFVERFRGAVDFDALLGEIADAVPGCRVAHETLERSSEMEFGPVTPILDLMDLAAPLRARLAPTPPANRGLGRAAREEMLALNRAGLEKADLKARKQALEKQRDKR